MYDMHYDLLTILYYNLKENNPKANIQKLKRDLLDMWKGNIKGGIINLYFMSEMEMLEELGIPEQEVRDVLTMFQQSIKYFKQWQKEGIIPSHIDYIYGIEGADFLQDEQQLETLYQLGLRSIIPVWNNENKFGSGNRSNKGLTILGTKLIKKAIELGIIIDVSHANQKTFYDILKVIDQSQERALLIASHSNVRSLCDRERNLTDDQLKALKNHDGYIGLFTNSRFVVENSNLLSHPERMEYFIEHIHYVIEKIHFSTKRIIISTDDMNFHPDPLYHNAETASLKTLYYELYEALSTHFSKEIAEDLLIHNSQNLLNKVKIKK